MCSARIVASARFVTPDEDVTLMFHCHVATHEKVGMAGRLIVGRGGERLAQARRAQRRRPPPAERRSFTAPAP